MLASEENSRLCAEIDNHLLNMALNDRITAKQLGCMDANSPFPSTTAHLAQRQPSELLGVDASAIHLYNCIQIVKKMHPWFTRYICMIPFILL
jgi:hypothetical protein